MTSPSTSSRNNQLCSLQNTIHEKIKYSYFSKTQAIAVGCASYVIKKQGKSLAQKVPSYDTWIFSEILIYERGCISNEYNYYLIYTRNNKAESVSNDYF